MLHIKITDKNGKTRNETQWGENITHEITKPGNTLCSDEVFHGFKNKYIAAFAGIYCGYDESTMQFWEAEGEVVADDGLKLGFKKQTTLHQIDVLCVTNRQRTEIRKKYQVLISPKDIMEVAGEKWGREIIFNIVQEVLENKK